MASPGGICWVLQKAQSWPWSGFSCPMPTSSSELFTLRGVLLMFLHSTLCTGPLPLRWGDSDIFSKFPIFINSFLHSIKPFLKGILHLADNPPLGSSRLHFAKSEKRPTVLGDQAASSASAQKTALFGIESSFQRQSFNISNSWVWKSRAMPSGLWNSWWW